MIHVGVDEEKIIEAIKSDAKSTEIVSLKVSFDCMFLLKISILK